MELIVMQKEELTSMIKDLVTEIVQPSLTELKIDKSNDDLMNTKSVMEYLKISRSTLNRRIESGHLIPHYCGGKVYFKKSELPFQ